MNLLPTNSLGGRFDCRYSAISCRLSAGSPPCVCYCATTYTLNWRHACFQTRTTRSPNHRHSSCIDDLEAALTASYPPIFPVLPPFFPGSSASSPVSPRCCGHFFVAPPQQQPTHSAPIFAALSPHFPTGSPARFLRWFSATSRGFCRNFPRFSAVFPWLFCRFSASPVAAVFSCAAAAKNDSAPTSPLTANSAPRLVPNVLGQPGTMHQPPGTRGSLRPLFNSVLPSWRLPAASKSSRLASQTPIICFQSSGASFLRCTVQLLCC